MLQSCRRFWGKQQYLYSRVPAASTLLSNGIKNCLVISCRLSEEKEHFQKIYPQALDKTKRQIKSIGLQENIGKGWYGHRVYAACSFLVNADVICYLDEDNWFEPDHVEKMVKKLEEDNRIESNL